MALFHLCPRALSMIFVFSWCLVVVVVVTTTFATCIVDGASWIPTTTMSSTTRTRTSTTTRSRNHAGWDPTSPRCFQNNIPTIMTQSSSSRLSCPSRSQPYTRLYAQQAGSFFNAVPSNNDNDEENDKDKNKSNNNKDEKKNNPRNDDDGENASSNDNNDETTSSDPFEQNIQKLLRQRKAPSLASQPSTLNGIPTSEQKGFGIVNPSNNTKKKKKKNNVVKLGSFSSSKNKPYIAIGPETTSSSSSSTTGGQQEQERPTGRLLNDPSKPEYDDQGYTLYANEVTGKKSRVFEALVEYPCDFTIKIVGANEGNFVQEMIAIVAESCHVTIDQVPYSIRTASGQKWLSVTVQAPVQSAEMLYQLYEDIGMYI